MTSAIFLRGARGDEYVIVAKRDVLDAWSSWSRRRFIDDVGDAAISEVRAKRPAWTMFSAFENAHASREQLHFELDRAMSFGRVVPVRIEPVSRGLDPQPSVMLRDLIKPKPDDPRTTDPVHPARTEQTFTYELRLVDEIGVPIDGVPLSLSVSGSPRRLTTDGDGRVRVDDATTSTALAQLPEITALRDVLRPRWEQVREGEWLTESEEHTYIDCADPLPMVKVSARRLHTIVVQPRVICARILELLFDTNKSFLLPSALEHIRAVRKLYDQRPRAKVLIVGHTDVTGEPSVNDPLSLNRAKAVQAYVTDDVKAWLDFYEPHMHPKARWGEHEDQLMLDAVLAESGEELTDTPLRHFQATRGLDPDGKLGPLTREVLVAEYMAIDGTTLPKGIHLAIHGCGANFPLAPNDPPGHTYDRRVELFFFDPDLGILPPAQGDNSGTNTREYPEWQRRGRETHTFRTTPALVVAHPTRSFPGTLFGFDSAFPTPGVSHLVKFAQELTDRHPEARIGLFGHADQRGDEAYNKKLSDRRSEVAFALLTEDFARFKNVADEEDWNVDCYQAMLRGLGCNPGAIDDTAGELTARAVRAFRQEYNDNAFHPGDRRARAFGELPAGDQLDRATKDAILDAYHADLSGAIRPDRFLGPKFSGCGEFNPCSDSDTENRRVTLAIWGEDAPSPAAFPCSKGDAAACDLVPIAGHPRRCRFYRDHILEDPPRDDIEPFWDFAWLETPTKKAHISALTMMSDCDDLSFTVQLAHEVPNDLGRAGFGRGVPEHGPVLGRLTGLVRKGVAYALWTPESYDPFDSMSWFRNVPIELASRETLPPYQPPIFTILGHGRWGIAGPPGADLRKLELVDDDGGPLVALRHDGKFIYVSESGGLSTLEAEHRIVAINRPKHRYVDPKEQEE